MFKAQLKKSLVSVIVMAVTGLLNSEVIDQLKQVVLAYMDRDMPGAQKREHVLAEMSVLGGQVGQVLASSSTLLINLALEAVVLWAKVKLEQVEI